MKSKIYLLNFIILSTLYVAEDTMAQEQLLLCGIDSVSSSPDSVYNPDPCIDVDEILAELEDGDNCRLIWINMNVHFFVLNTSLNNLITPSGYTVSQANGLAEDLINSANYTLYTNCTQLNQTGAVKLCNPFQYVLKGVYIHILENTFNARTQLASIHSNYGININSEFNLYIGPCSSCSGVVTSEGGTTAFLNVASMDGRVLNHEWGHTMGLKHSWRDDFISDTPPISFNLDRNCDGNISNIQDDKEIEQQCWNKITASDPVNGETDQIGPSWNSTQKRWYNNVNDCSESNPCPTSPCCLDEYQNNNVMAYNAHQCSFTFLQIKKTLQQLLSYKCDYINTIQTNRTCWAPSAFISFPLPGNEDYGYCSTCFDFTASYNEHKYLVRVYKTSGGALIYNSGWLYSTAGKLCFKNYGISVGTGRYLEPDEDYRIELTVARDPVGGQNCDLTDTYIRYFTTGACEPDYYDPPLVFTEMIISPNPSSSSIELTYDAFEGEEFAIFAVNQSTAQLSLLSNSMHATANGENDYELSISSLSNGTYTIFMIGVENNHYQTLLKQ